MRDRICRLIERGMSRWFGVCPFWMAPLTVEEARKISICPGDLAYINGQRFLVDSMGRDPGSGKVTAIIKEEK